MERRGSIPRQIVSLRLVRILGSALAKKKIKKRTLISETPYNPEELPINVKPIESPYNEIKTVKIVGNRQTRVKTYEAQSQRTWKPITPDKAKRDPKLNKRMKLYQIHLTVQNRGKGGQIEQHPMKTGKTQLNPCINTCKQKKNPIKLGKTQ